MISKSKIFQSFFSVFSIIFFTAFSAAVFGQVSLTASPIEVAAGGGIGRTTISWQIEDGTNARLFLVQENGAPVQISQGRAGKYTEDFIFPNRTYEFRLYPADSSEKPLATVFVKGTYEINYLPDFQTLYRKVLMPWAAPLILICLLLFGARRLKRRRKKAKLQKIFIASALLLATLGAAIVIGRGRGAAFDTQPAPDAQETMDAAKQMVEGNGYVTYYHENTAQPPRYPPSFSIALTPFAVAGEYPANVIFGAKFYALLYLALAIFAAWIFGGRYAALLAAIFIGVSPFAEHYAKIVMSEAFTASLILLTIVLLHKPSLKRAAFAGALIGILVTTRLQMIVCIPALVLALPTMRQRVWAALAGAPFLLANGIYNWRTFGSFTETGYDYWLPNVKALALEFALRAYPQGDGPWLVQDWLRGWLMIWVCPCEKGGPLAALPNIVFYPLLLLGFFWIFAPPFIPLYGLLTVWKKRRAPAAQFTLWLAVFSTVLFTFYFYQAARFMTAVSTLLLLFAAVALGKKLQRLIEADPADDAAAPPFGASVSKT